MSSLHTIHDEQTSEIYRIKQAEALLQQKLNEIQQKVKQYEADLQKKKDSKIHTFILDIKSPYTIKYTYN